MLWQQILMIELFLAKAHSHGGGINELAFPL